MLDKKSNLEKQIFFEKRSIHCQNQCIYQTGTNVGTQEVHLVSMTSATMQTFGLANVYHVFIT